MTLVIRLDGLPPSLNNLYPQNRATGRRYMSQAGRDWHTLVALTCARDKIAPFADKRVRLSIAVEFIGASYRQDIDNLLKCCIDSLADVLGFSDRYVEQITACRVPTTPGEQPHTRVTLMVREQALLVAAGKEGKG